MFSTKHQTCRRIENEVFPKQFPNILPFLAFLDASVLCETGSLEDFSSDDIVTALSGDGSVDGFGSLLSGDGSSYAS